MSSGMRGIAIVTVIVSAFAVIASLPGTATLGAEETKQFGSVFLDSYNDGPIVATLWKRGQVVKTTSIHGKGNSRWSKVEPGNYSLRLEADGYKTQIIPTSVDASEEVKIDVALSKGNGVLVFGDNPPLEVILKRLSDLKQEVETLKEKVAAITK